MDASGMMLLEISVSKLAVAVRAIQVSGFRRSQRRSVTSLKTCMFSTSAVRTPDLASNYDDIVSFLLSQMRGWHFIKRVSIEIRYF
jgi:hypothetical protein